MDEKNYLKLRVLERTEEMLTEIVEEQTKPKFEHPHQTNPLAKPIYKDLAKFHNEKIGEKFSAKDLLR